MSGQRPRRPGFGLTLAACWVVGFLVLSGGQVALLTVVVGLGALIWSLVAADRRKRVVARARWDNPGSEYPRPCVTVRRLGMKSASDT